VVHFGRFLTLDLKCTGTFWASSTGCLTFDPKCTDTFWAVSTGLWLPKCTGTFWMVSPFDTKCTGTFWAVSAERLTFDPKCTGTFWVVPTVLWLTCLAFECECSPTHSRNETLVVTWWFIVSWQGIVLQFNVIVVIPWAIL
jgi:hypothetical protein